ncbi:Vsp/OspC family lipoprotein [Borreliella valaisiana]|uniref:Vsp/OspC family lipoprotein n=1 Tax=Borreliella valaisiana TaxID=62088 RepID=UPI002ED4F7B8|nr:Vsp/OspC family lipoprotein [Borreliella valaisiana]WVN14824.1 Vsp/OspC family lipoprotein [Borreliella valaisiana]
MKKNTLSAILMTLFLFISCNNSGKGGDTNPDESAKGPNLTVISKKITDSNSFVLAVKEVEALISSIGELAKAIGKKIQQNGLEADADKNTALLAGAYAISDLITEKLNGLIKNSGELKVEVEKAKNCSEAFTKKLKDSRAELGVAAGAATDENAKKAILTTNVDKGKGAKELKELSESVESLLQAAKEALANSVGELTSPVVTESPKKS